MKQYSSALIILLILLLSLLILPVSAHFGETTYHEDLEANTSWKWEVRTFDREETDTFPLREGDTVRIDIIANPDVKDDDAFEVYINDRLQENFTQFHIFIQPLEGLENMASQSEIEGDQLIYKGDLIGDCDGAVIYHNNGLLDVHDVDCNTGTLTIVRNGISYIGWFNFNNFLIGSLAVIIGSVVCLIVWRRFFTE